jgi:hypothetical protein
MLLVVDPVTLVLGSVGVRILSEAMRLVVLPLAIIDITVCVNKPSTSVSLIMLPISLVYASIAPNLISSAMSEASFHIPLALVLGAVRQDHHLSLLFMDAWLVVLVVISSVLELRQVFPNCLNAGTLLL